MKEKWIRGGVEALVWMKDRPSAAALVVLFILSFVFMLFFSLSGLEGLHHDKRSPLRCRQLLANYDVSRVFPEQARSWPMSPLAVGCPKAIRSPLPPRAFTSSLSPLATTTMPSPSTALIIGASRGLGLALTKELNKRNSPLASLDEL